MIGRISRPTVLIIALLLLCGAKVYADSFPNTPETPHAWSRRAILHRHSVDRYRFAPPYHAGMLAFLPRSAGYLHAYGTDTTESPDLGPLGDSYFRNPFGLHLGSMWRLHDRIGVGLDGSFSIFSDNMGDSVGDQEDEEVFFDPHTGVASVSLGVRLSRVFALSGMLGVSANTYGLVDDRDFVNRTEPGDDWIYDGIWSLGIVWALPERDVWAGVRVTRDLFFNRPNYVMPLDTGSGNEYPGFFVETAQPWRTEGFFRLGLFDGRLLLAFSGAVERYDADRHSTDYTTETFGPTLDKFDQLYVIRRSFGIEYAFTERVAVRAGFHPTDMVHQDIVGDIEERNRRTKRLTVFGASAGVSVRLASFLLDIGASWRDEPVEVVAHQNASVQVADLSIGLIWEAAP